MLKLESRNLVSMTMEWIIQIYWHHLQVKKKFMSIRMVSWKEPLSEFCIFGVDELGQKSCKEEKENRRLKKRDKIPRHKKNLSSIRYTSDAKFRTWLKS